MGGTGEFGGGDGRKRSSLKRIFLSMKANCSIDKMSSAINKTGAVTNKTSAVITKSSWLRQTVKDREESSESRR